MNKLQIFGYVGLSISILVGALLFVKIIILMCKNQLSYFDDDDDEERKKKKSKVSPHQNYETKEGSVETASMCSEECELLDKKRRQQEQSSTIKTHSISDGHMIEMETLQKGSSSKSFSKKSHSNSNSDSGFSNQASRSGMSTVWCEIYPKQDDPQHSHTTTTSAATAVEARSPISTSSSGSTSSTHHNNHHHHEDQYDQQEILDDTAGTRSLSPFSQQLTTHRQESVGNYAFSSEYKSIDDVDTPNNDAENNFEVLRRRAQEVNNEVLSISDPLPNASSSGSQIITTTDVNCNLIIVTVATKTKIVGYCLNVLKQKCSFYTYNIESLPVQLFFKIFQAHNTSSSSSPEDGYFSVQNLKFALLLWRKKIAKYNRFRLYTDHPAVADANCLLVKELRVYINHLQHCEGKSVLVNYDNFMIKPQEAQETPMMFVTYRRYIQPALYLQSDQIEFFEFTLNNSFGIQKTDIHGTHSILQEAAGGDDDSFFDSSTTEKFSTNLKKVQQSLQQWDNRSCQCSSSVEVDEQVPTYIS